MADRPPRSWTVSLGSGFIAASSEEFDRFVDENNPTADEVEARLADDFAFIGPAKIAAKFWLSRQRRQETTRAEEERLVLERRSVEAAERSAEAAHKSARWAVWSACIALASMFVTAWVLFKIPGNWLLLGK